MLGGLLASTRQILLIGRSASARQNLLTLDGISGVATMNFYALKVGFSIAAVFYYSHSVLYIIISSIY